MLVIIFPNLTQIYLNYNIYNHIMYLLQLNQLLPLLFQQGCLYLYVKVIIIRKVLNIFILLNLQLLLLFQQIIQLHHSCFCEFIMWMSLTFIHQNNLKVTINLALHQICDQILFKSKMKSIKFIYELLMFLSHIMYKN